jgi:phospholipase C
VPSNLEKIDHIVVLMMEGASFDHLLGYLRLKQLLPVDGLKKGDASHLHRDESHVWAYDYLARTFAVCDRWFASVPGPAMPNRLFAVSGAAPGGARDPAALTIYGGVTTVFDCLDRALYERPGHERWGYYFHDLPLFGVLRQHMDELIPNLPRRILNFLAGSIRRIRHVEDFFERARQGSLPALSWIDPSFADGEAEEAPPARSDLFEAQSLVTRVYHAILEGGDGLWKKTLLVVTHAEHGSDFDHVPPSASGDPAPFDRFGWRVPALVVSAWTPPVVDGAERDHTCLLRTILDRFAPGERLTSRVARAASLDGLLSLPAPRRDAGPIAIPDPRYASTRRAAAPAAERGGFLRAYRQELKRRGL